MSNLATTGMLIDDTVVDAYLSLLVNECHRSLEKDHLATVQCGTYPWMAEQGGYEAGAHNFTNKSVHFLPGFFGADLCGHWTAIIIDLECAKEEGGTLVFLDSIASCRQSNYKYVETTFQNSPHAVTRRHYVLIEQAVSSMDCAVFIMLDAFAHWDLRSDIALLPTKFQSKDGVSTAIYGCQMRRHIHETIKNCKIDLNDQILRSMLLS